MSLTNNNYLGFSSNQDVIDACKASLDVCGTSSGGSPLLGGTLSVHKRLESELSRFVGKEETMLFTSGYAANLGIIGGLVGNNDMVIIDKLVHASIIDGVSLAKSKFKTFLHNDVDALERRLQQVPEGMGTLVIVDGVYSMEADIAPLEAIVKLKEKYNFLLLVDDAHAIGVLGPKGEGTSKHFGVTEGVDLIMGTMSKGLSGAGGFLSGDREVITYLRYFARSSMFSSNITPTVASGVIKALEILNESGEAVVSELHAKIARMRDGLAAAHIFAKGDHLIPIINIPIPGDLVGRIVCKELFDKGLLCNSIPAPIVPRGQSCIRIRVTRLHSNEQIDYSVKAIEEVFLKHGLTNNLEQISKLTQES